MSVSQQLHIYPSLNLASTLTCYQLNKGGKFLKKLWCLSVGEYSWVIWTELITTVKSFKADISRITPSSGQI